MAGRCKGDMDDSRDQTSFALYVMLKGGIAFERVEVMAKNAIRLGVIHPLDWQASVDASKMPELEKEEENFES